MFSGLRRDWRKVLFADRFPLNVGLSACHYRAFNSVGIASLYGIVILRLSKVFFIFKLFFEKCQIYDGNIVDSDFKQPII